MISSLPEIVRAAIFQNNLVSGLKNHLLQSYRRFSLYKVFANTRQSFCQPKVFAAMFYSLEILTVEMHGVFQCLELFQMVY